MTKIETIKVTRIGSGKQTTINKDDFDPAKHELPGQSVKAEKTSKKKSKKKAK